MRPTLILLLLALLLLPVACGDDEPTAPPAAPLEGVTLESGSAASLGKVRVEGLPPGKAPEDYRVRVQTDGTDDLDLPLESDAEGPFFWAPLHPIAPNQGGDVQVRVTDGDQASPELPLDLQALPAAPGAFANLVDALREHVDQRAVWAGSSFTDLQGQAFDAVDPALLPLKVAQSYIDAGTTTDLAALVDNQDGVLTADGRELLDRLFGYAPLVELVQDDIDSFETLESPGARSRPIPHAPKRDCLDEGPEITTAEELSEAMLVAARANVAINPDSPPGRTLEALGVMLSAGGVIPGYGTVFSVAGIGLAAWQGSRDMIASTYPSSFTSLEYDLDKAEFKEDFLEVGQWSNVRVVAASTGWIADAALANLVVSTLGAVLSGGQVLELMEAEFLRDAAITGLNLALGAYLEDNGGLIEFCAKTWDVDITEEPYSTASALDRRFQVDMLTRTIEPLEVGDDILRVAAQPSEFAGQEIHLDKPIVTRPIIVDVVPDLFIVGDPGETIQVRGEIMNAVDEALVWTTQQGSWTDGLGSDTNGPTTRGLQTPISPADYPFLITVESRSRGGLRADGTPARLDIATVRIESPAVEIRPASACISPGETLQFEAVVTGTENTFVTWSVVEGQGSISQNGLYQSLSEGTSFAVVEANLVAEDDVFDTATVDVQGCTCHYTLFITGDHDFRGGGPDIAYRVSDFGDGPIYQFFIQPPQDAEDALIGISLTPTEEQATPEPGDTGTYEVSFLFSPFPGSAGWAASPDREESGVFLELEELTATSMRGRLTGMAVQYDGEDVSSVVFVDMPFVSARQDGAWPCQ